MAARHGRTIGAVGALWIGGGIVACGEVLDVDSLTTPGADGGTAACGSGSKTGGSGATDAGLARRCSDGAAGTQACAADGSVGVCRCTANESGAACGASGQACCNRTECNAGLTCSGGTCAAPEPCGASGEACCNGTECNAGSMCSGGTCISPPRRDGNVDAVGRHRHGEGQ